MCVTCKRWYPFKQLQAGHFIQGRTNAILFDERLVYTQCLGCNGRPPYGKGGNYVEYFRFMEKEWSRTILEELIALKYKTKVLKLPDLIEIKETYDKKTQDLLSKVKL